MARGAGVEVVAVAGSCALDRVELTGAGFGGVFTLSELEPDLGRCLAQAEPLLERLGGRIAEFLTGDVPDGRQPVVEVAVGVLERLRETHGVDLRITGQRREAEKSMEGLVQAFVISCFLIYFIHHISASIQASTDDCMPVRIVLLDQPPASGSAGTSYRAPGARWRSTIFSLCLRNCCSSF